MEKIIVRNPKAGTAPIPKSCQIGFDGNRKAGIQFPNKGANNQAMIELMKSMPIRRPSVDMPNKAHAPITRIASNSAESPGNKVRAITR